MNNNRCLWCEKELKYDNILGFCSFNCQEFQDIKVRKIIWEFALEIEKEMQIKDKRNYTHYDKSLEFLIDKLNEKRKEVDFELNDLPSYEVTTELLHEATMTMLIRDKIKQKSKINIKKIIGI